MNRIWTIAKRELKVLFDHPTGYILVVVFLALNNFLFFRQAYLMSLATLRPMLDLLPWLLLFFVPAVTMRSLAEEVRGGTIEVVLAQPVTELEFLIGKYVGQLLFICFGLALTFAIPLGLSLGADIQVGVVFAQYVGAAMLAAGFTSVGMWASSLTRNQITAFIIGVAVMFLLVFIGLNAQLVGLPPVLAAVAANLGVLSHFENIARGLLDLRDLIYFTTLAAIFLILAYWVLVGRKLAPTGEALKRLRAGATMLVATMVVVNLFGRQIKGRIDLTPGNAYTLSPASKEIVSTVDDRVTVTLFASKELPTEIALRKRDVEDLLGDLRSASAGRVRYVVRDPSDDEDAANQAQAVGIPPVQFNVYGQAELTVKEGYFGLSVQYADDTETIPLIQRTDDLEYRLVSFIRSLTRAAKPIIGIVAQAGPQGQLGVSTLQQQLGTAYETRVVSIERDSLSVAQMPAIVVAGGGGVLADSVVDKVSAYLAEGGSALVLASGMELSPQQPFASPSPVGWNRLLEPYGVSIRPDMAYDLMSNERVAVPASFGRILMAYPFWVRAVSTRLASMNQEIETVFFPWGSTVDTSNAAPGTVTPLFTTTEAGGVESGQAFIAPQRQDYSREDLASRLLGAVINPLNTEGEDDSGSERLRGRIVVIGNGDFVSDQYVANAPQNVVFVLNAVDWLAQDEALVSIRSKNRTPPSLSFSSATKRDLARYGNIIGVPLLVIVAGFIHVLRRRRRTRQQYVPLTAGAA